jgi:hypothetical protein
MEDLEKNNIQDAEVDEVNISKKKKNKNYNAEIILILIIGLLLGVMLKAEALKNISVGFSDYKIKGGQQGYDLDAIEDKLIEEGKKQQEEAAQAAQEKAGAQPTMPTKMEK